VTATRRPELVSLDVDGTLYSLHRARVHLAWRMMREVVHGRGGAASGEVRALKRRARLIEECRAAGGALDAQAQAWCLDHNLLAIERRWLAGAIARTGLRPGLLALLDRLAARGIPAVVISDHIAGYKLAALGIRDRFTSLYEGVRLGWVKPSPMPFERAAADAGVPTSTLLHIGDRDDTDGVAARSAGCRVCIIGRDIRSVREVGTSRWGLD
jgi:FMN phosphatase YigB (HAD superfamily)